MTLAAWMAKYRGIVTDRAQAESALSDFRLLCQVQTPILWGYGLIGKNLASLLSSLGISYMVVDKNPATHMPSPDTLKSIDDPDEYVLIASVNPLTAPSVANDLVALQAGFKQVLSGYELHKTLQSATCTLGHEPDLRACYECSIMRNSCPVRAGGKARMVGYALGNVCNLKCAGCIESAPVAPSKYFVPTQEVIADIRRFACACEYLTVAEFVGGEPFLHPGLADIISEALKIKNIDRIDVATNGTVVPRPCLCQVLAHPRVGVYVSNYSDALSKKANEAVAKTIDVLTAAGVRFARGSHREWYDTSSFEPTNDDDARLAERFQACCFRTCNRLHRGRLYRCPHHLAGVTLGKLDPGDVVDIRDGNIAAKLEAFAAQPFADACRYCPMPFNAPFVSPGVQA